MCEVTRSLKSPKSYTEVTKSPKWLCRSKSREIQRNSTPEIHHIVKTWYGEMVQLASLERVMFCRHNYFDKSGTVWKDFLKYFGKYTITPCTLLYFFFYSSSFLLPFFPLLLVYFFLFPLFSQLLITDFDSHVCSSGWYGYLIYMYFWSLCCIKNQYLKKGNASHRTTETYFLTFVFMPGFKGFSLYLNTELLNKKRTSYQ